MESVSEVRTPGGTAEDGVEAFLLDHGGWLMRVARGLAGTPQDAEDLWQDTAADLVRHWARVGDARSPRAYARTVMTRRHISNHRRRWRTERPLAPGSAAETPTPDGTAAVDGLDALWSLLAGLPARQRAVLVLRYVEDLDDRAIAEVLGAAPGTVRSLASRALATLREKETR